MRKFVESTGATGHKPRALPAGILATALTMVTIVALAATPREELATRGLDFTADMFVAQAGAGESETVKLFLAAGMDVNEQGVLRRPPSYIPINWVGGVLLMPRGRGGTGRR